MPAVTLQLGGEEVISGRGGKAGNNDSETRLLFLEEKGFAQPAKIAGLRICVDRFSTTAWTHQAVWILPHLLRKTVLKSPEGFVLQDFRLILGQQAQRER